MKNYTLSIPKYFCVTGAEIDEMREYMEARGVTCDFIQHASPRSIVTMRAPLARAAMRALVVEAAEAVGFDASYIDLFAGKPVLMIGKLAR